MKTFFEKQQSLISLAVTLFLGVIVGITFFALRNWEKEFIIGQFKLDAEERILAIERQIQTNIGAMESMYGFYLTSNFVDREEFETFSKTLLERHQSLRAVEWAPRVPFADKNLHIDGARKEGLVSYEILKYGPKELRKSTQEPPEYFPIFYSRSTEGTDFILGLDLLSEPQRQQTVRRAIDSTHLEVTPLIDIAHEVGRSQGVLMVKAVYQKGFLLTTLPTRRDHVDGLLIGVIRPKELVHQALNILHAEDINVAIIEVAESPRTLYEFVASHQKDSYSTPFHEEASVLPQLAIEKPITIGAQKWIIRCVPTTNFFNAHRTNHPWVVLLFGLFLTAIAGFFVFQLLGRTKRIANIVTDRTTALQAAHQKMKTLVENIVDGVITINHKGVIESFNKAAENIFGYEAEEVIGHNIKMLMPEPDQSRHDQYLKNYLNSGQAKIIGKGREVQGLRKNGNSFPMELSVGKIRIGEQLLFTGIVRDITAKKAATDLLQRNAFEARLLHEATRMASESRSFSDSLRKSIAIICQLTGWPVGHAYVLSPENDHLLIPSDIWYPEDPTLYAEFKRVTQETTFTTGEGLPGRILQSGKPDWIPNVRLNQNFPRNRKSSELGVKGAFGFPLKVANKTVAVLEFFSPKEETLDDNLFVTVNSVGEQLSRVFERKKAAERLEIAKDMAEAANKSKSEFLANMSHELRTPLNSVIGFANILLKNKNQTPTDSDINYLNRISNNGKHLLGLINSILDLAKIEAGKMAVEVEVVDCKALCKEIFDQLDDLARGKGIRLILDLPEKVDPINTDKIKLRQIILNLVGNAIKFTEEGSVTLRIATPPDSGVLSRIDVIDTGIGIPPAQIKNIFEPFVQANGTTKRTHGGTGLGLSISKNFLNLMGFSLQVESELGKGSAFHIHTPLDPLQGQPSPTPLVAPRMPTSPSLHAAEPRAAGDMKPGAHLVLVIDDESNSRILMMQTLEEMGCEVITANSGPQGIKMAKRLKPELILLDLMMPIMDGFEFLGLLQKEPKYKDIPVVIVTAKDLNRNEMNELGKEVATILQKGENLEADLKNVVRKLLQVEDVSATENRWVH